MKVKLQMVKNTLKFIYQQQRQATLSKVVRNTCQNFEHLYQLVQKFMTTILS